MVRGVYHGQNQILHESRHHFYPRQGGSGVSRQHGECADGARFLQYPRPAGGGRVVPLYRAGEDIGGGGIPESVRAAARRGRACIDRRGGVRQPPRLRRPC